MVPPTGLKLLPDIIMHNLLVLVRCYAETVRPPVGGLGIAAISFIEKSQLMSIFSLCKFIPRAGLDHLVGQIWPAGRMCDTPALEYK